MSSTAKIAEELLEEPAAVGVLLDDALAGVVERVESGQPIIETVATGLELLDSTTGGLVRGEYLGIVAAPGLGKSTFADGLAVGVLERNPEATALILNLETATPVRVARLIGGRAVRIGPSGRIVRCVPIGAMLRGELDAPGQATVREVAAEMRERLGARLRFVDDVSDAAGIAGLIEQLRPTVVVVDHCGLVGTGDRDGGATERFDDALHIVAGAVKSVNAAGVLITEINKLALSEGKADLAAVRGSARFGSLAGQLVGLVRDMDDIDENPRLLIQLWKNRHGRSYIQQAARFFGGLSYLDWHEVEPITVKKPKGRDKAAPEAEAA